TAGVQVARQVDGVGAVAGSLQAVEAVIIVLKGAAVAVDCLCGLAQGVVASLCGVTVHVAKLVALMLLALTAHSPAQAQNPGGDALQKTAAGLRDALLNGTPDELFNKLAPWMRGRVELFDERLPEQLREYKEKMPEK